MFSTETYVHRRQQLQQNLKSGLILLLGNEDSPMNYHDNTYPFRQDSTFLYYFGLDLQHLAAIIDLDEDTTTIFGDELSMDYIVWMGAQPTIVELATKTGVTNTQPYNKISEALRVAKSLGRPIHFLPPYRGENRILLSELLDIPIPALENRASVDLIKAVVNQRSIKSIEEIAEIEKAVNVCKIMHRTVMQKAEAGVKEVELRGTLEGIAVSHGGYPAYSTILTVNGQTLHNHFYGNVLQSGQLLLGDFGAATERDYCGDITRTFPVDSTFTSKQRDIYNLVLQAEIKGIELLQPGVRYLDVHLAIAKLIASGLKDLGLMQGDVNEAVAQGAHALFFPHGLGHMLGLDVHDMEDLGEQYVGYTDELQRSTQFGLKSLRLAKELQPGFVLTVEPGIYFIPQLIDLWESEGKFKEFINYNKLKEYHDFGGIRIEDNVVVTENSCRVLGEPIEKTVEEVEALRQGHL